jgi:phosphinothricin acetyltransferase
MKSQVRIAAPDDAPGILAIYAPLVRETAITFETEPPTEDEMRARVAAGLAVYPWLVYERRGQLLGYAYATRHRARPAYDWTVEVSVYVAEEARRQGVAREPYRALLPILERQGFVTAVAAIALPNPASVRLHEALGFLPVGVFPRAGHKLGAWRDVEWWHRPLAEPAAPPAPPVPFEQVRAAVEAELASQAIGSCGV